jgi:osmotically-inducible protein OsmY
VVAALTLLAGAGCERGSNQQQTTASNTASNAPASRKSPDWWTTTKVQAKFFADNTVKGRDIDVDTSDGVVTLKGTVDSPAAKTRAIALASSVDGVSAVNDNLVIKGSGQATDANGGGQGATGAVATSGREVVRSIQPAWITTKIQAQYFADPTIKPWNIDVTTMSDGTVTLDGTVDTADARSKAESIARNTDGVKTVDDNLRVIGSTAAPGAASERPIEQPDAWLTAKVQSKYYMSDAVRARDIDVDTHGGVVTLTGTVASTSERDEADAIARSTDGVKDVKDNLRIEVTPASAHLNPVERLPEANRVSTDDWITTKIRSRYFLDPTVKNMDVDVTTDDGVVTLSGNVQSEAAKTAAEAIAKSTEGVTQVKNQLTVKQ